MHYPWEPIGEIGDSFFRFEGQGDGVDAVAQRGRIGAVVEDMAEVGVAVRAPDLGAHHTVAVVGAFHDTVAREGGEEARPAAVRVELGVRAEQLVATADTAIDTGLAMLDELAAERWLRPSLACGTAPASGVRANPGRTPSARHQSQRLSPKRANSTRSIPSTRPAPQNIRVANIMIHSAS